MGTSRAYVEATLLILFGWIILLKYYECGPTTRQRFSKSRLSALSL